MSLEIEGKIISKLPVQSGTSARGPWQKQEFVIEYQEGNYPTQVCMNVWGEDKVKDLERFQAGTPVKVSFNLSSREYNGRWYTDIRAWRIENSNGSAPAQQPVTGPVTTTVTPATQASPAASPATDDLGDSSTDDLPF